MSETELTPEQVEGIANDAGVGLADHNRRSRCLCLRCQSGRALLLTRRQLEQAWALNARHAQAAMKEKK